VIEMNRRAALLILAPISLSFASLFMGRYFIAPDHVFMILLDGVLPNPSMPSYYSSLEQNVIASIRLPRIVLALLVGAGLSISGAVFQGLFRNPLVSPDILGVAGGAGFGAALAVIFTTSSVIIQLSALAFGMVAVYMSYMIGRERGETSILTLVLSGIIIGAVFSALISLVKYVADPFEKLPTIVFWLMGSFASCTIGTVLFALPGIVIGMLVLLSVRWRINVLSMGDVQARLLGVNTERLKVAVITAATVVVAVSVSVSGIIGWIGLIVPHMGRMLVGSDHKALLPASLSIGACLLLVVDDLARTLTTADLPLGVLTAFVGAPFFVYLLRRGRKMGWMGT
jgi:iron complex transport system permease protein